MKQKIFRQSLSLTVVTLLLLVLTLGGILYYQLQQSAFNNLKKELTTVESVYQKDALAGLQKYAWSDRITVIAKDGQVLFDSQAEPAKMDNHNQRPEVKAARQAESGISKRNSTTLATQNFYYAKLLPDQKVLRLASTEESFFQVFYRLAFWAGIVLLGLIILIAFFARRFAQRLVEPINQLNLAEPEKNQTYPELAPLLGRLTDQKKEIDAQVMALSQQEKQLVLITDHMSEGLVLLDAQDQLLFANPQARQLFQLQPSDFQQPFVQVGTVPQLMAALEKSHQSNQELIFRREDRTYRLVLNPVLQEGRFVGTVLFLFDATAEVAQETLRREFTANVTHELKTPLTSISGYAELIHAGIVQPADITRFAGKIYEESQRLITLVNGILKLSELEQDTQLQPERIAWHQLFQQLESAWQFNLAQKEQTLLTEYSELPFTGYPSVLKDILDNLISNAHKYSGEKSTIWVSLKKADQGIQLSVADSGPGISLSDRERVFERFYRGDKSRSSQIEGSGLGLSIVKHGVLLHHGQIRVTDRAGGGTEFVVTLPQNFLSGTTD